MLEKLKKVLIGKEFEENNYYDELTKIASQFGLETNTCDFDNERIYNKGYENKECWEDELVAVVEIQFIPIYDEHGEIDCYHIRIVDVY